ncbi:branched-chain amino acid ABC transporter substrate-binding protein [Amphibiibacter pelophylacis]|uniref:Branched-chain amino acid ABC transporter substrate-binding protein n=1 Tax=Amphibiibacter pelophylacis TaxID=1799477 RepID=A0ACC6P598_9BURK
MTKTPKHTRTALRATALAAAGLLAALVSAPALADQTVVIGLSSPLSGGQADFGGDNRDGAQMAVDALNAKGISVGGQTIKFKLQAEDDSADPKQGVAVAQKLVDEKVGYVVGPYNSGVTIPATKVYRQGGAVVATVSTNPEVTASGYDRIFRTTPSDSQIGARMAEFAAADLKIKRVAVIDDRTSYGQGIAGVFAEAAKKLGIQVVSTQYTNDKATDFTGIVTSLRGAKPDAVFYGGYSAQAGPMLRQMKMLGLGSVKMLGGDAICSTQTSDLAQGAISDAVYCGQGGTMLDKATAGQSFIAQYKARYKRDPLTYAVTFYDSVMMFANAMQKAGSTDPAKVAAWIHANPYAGIAGEYAFDAKGNQNKAGITVYQFKGAAPVAIKSM